MRILVCPNELKIGGSQLNAIDLATAARDRGHDVALLSRPGPLCSLIADRGLEFIEAEIRGARPSWRTIHQISKLVRDRKIDIVHAYESNLTLEAYFGAHVLRRVPVVGSVMTMWAPPLPSAVTIVMGTPALKRSVSRKHGGIVHCLEPPVDTASDCPGLPSHEFRSAFGIDDHAINVVMITRLDHDLKLEGIERAIRAVGRLGQGVGVRLILVGDGEGFAHIKQLATQINHEAGKDLIIVTGSVLDPREAYSCADIVLGQGSSTLRGMAFGKPCLVIGQDGFAKVVDERSIGEFLDVGFHGIGDGTCPAEELSDRLRDRRLGVASISEDDPGIERLLECLRPLIGDADRRHELGDFSHDVVHDRFSLDSAAGRLLEVYRDALAARSSMAVVRDDARNTARLSAAKAKGSTVRFIASRRHRLTMRSGV